MSRPQSWYFVKANAFAEAWKQIFGSYPPRCAVVLGLSVAIHETNAGESVGWEGEHNWGACTLRPLNAAEHNALAGIPPHPNHVEAARNALALAGLTEPGGALHADSSPQAGWYFVWFARFNDDTAGAKYFVHVLAEQHSSTAVVLRDPMATEYMLAERMYLVHYFLGFRNPKALWEFRGGKWVVVQPADPVEGRRITGVQLNIEEYANALRAVSPEIADALRFWTPGDAAPSLDDLLTVIGQQRALIRAGADITADGIMGPKTRAAIIAFQRDHGLIPDGIVGPRTRAALAQ